MANTSNNPKRVTRPSFPQSTSQHPQSEERERIITIERRIADLESRIDAIERWPNEFGPVVAAASADANIPAARPLVPGPVEPKTEESQS